VVSFGWHNEAVRQTLGYLQSPEFSNSMEAITDEAMNMYKELHDEVKKHLENWRKRYYSYVKIYAEALKVNNTTQLVLSGRKPISPNSSKSDTDSFPQLQKTSIELPLEPPKQSKKDKPLNGAPEQL
jgi:hypothetical protein